MRLYLCQELDRSRGCPSAAQDLDRGRGYTPTFFAVGAIAIFFWCYGDVSVFWSVLKTLLITAATTTTTTTTTNYYCYHY